MKLVSLTSAEIARKKRFKLHRSGQEKACKIVAFQQLTSLKQSQISKRKAAALLEVPFSTMKSWKPQKSCQELEPELVEFISTPGGQKFLSRLIASAFMAIRYGHGGIRAIQEFLQLSKLDNFVASSTGALHAYVVRAEKHMVAFGASQEMLLAQGLKQRKITAGLDEMFRGRHPCLVAIEIVSGYILLEKFTDDRSAETWIRELKPKLAKLDVQIDQVVSDLCGGIRACAKGLEAVHSPDIFHAQQEITKATSAPLASQEEAFRTAFDDADKKLQKAIEKHGEHAEKSKQARIMRNLRGIGYEARKERRKNVGVAKKELGRAHHPINLQTGKLQTSEGAKEAFNKQLTIIEECAQEADLSSSCMKRLAKARRAFNGISEYLAYFLVFFAAYMRGLKLTPEQELFFKDVAFPLSYLNMIWRRLSKKDREELHPLRERLKNEFEYGRYSEKEKAEWMVKGRECAERFQRSTSCVEGRNGVLSLYHHRFCRLNQRSCQALTAIHNFHLKRQDGRTAATRFFGNDHENLFESLVMNVCIPGTPKKKIHGSSKRLSDDLENGEVRAVGW